MGPVTTASSSPRRASVTASSSAAAAARAVSRVGCPKEQSGYLPTILYSADFGTRSAFSARSTISGPIPAQSPSVIPTRGRIRHLPSDPPPVCTRVASPVLGVNVGQASDCIAAGQSAEHSRGHRSPPRAIPAIVGEGDHGHTQLDLLLFCELTAVLPVVFCDL